MTGGVKHFGVEEDTCARSTAYRNLLLEIQFVGLNISSAGFLSLLIRNVVAASDELRPAVLSHHVIQAYDY